LAAAKTPDESAAGGVLIMADQIATIEFRNVVPEVTDE
jgi:hypothetical protein